MSLLELFNRHRSELVDKIDRAGNPTDVARIVRSYLGSLQTEFTGGLTVPQARLAISLLDAVGSALDAITAVNNPRDSGRVERDRRNLRFAMVIDGYAVSPLL